MKLLIISLFLALLFLNGSAKAEDWPQWRGMNRDGITSESSGYDEDGWPPAYQWTIDPGYGNSSPIIIGNLMYVMGNRSINGKDIDIVYCLRLSDLDAGKSLEKSTVWSYSYQCSKGKGSDYDNLGGPSSTPAYDYSSDCLFTLSKKGHLKCFENAKSSGNLRWERDIRKDYDPVSNSWDHNCSPLILDDKVIVEVGDYKPGKNKYTGTLVAFSVSDGREMWHAGNSKGGASSPIAFKVNGTKCVAIRSGAGKLWVVKASDGSIVAAYPWSSSIPIPTLAVNGAKLFGTNSYGSPGSCYLNVKLSKPGYEELFTSKEIRSNVQSPIIWKEHVFCTDCPDGFNVHNKGPIKCMSLSGDDRGQVKWTSVDSGSKDLFGHGPILLCANDERIMALNAHSHKLILVNANPSQGYSSNRIASAVLKEVPVSPKHTRTDPGYTYTMVLANRRLYVRSQDGQIYCYSVSTKRY